LRPAVPLIGVASFLGGLYSYCSRSTTQAAPIRRYIGPTMSLLGMAASLYCFGRATYDLATDEKIKNYSWRQRYLGACGVVSRHFMGDNSLPQNPKHQVQVDDKIASAEVDYVYFLVPEQQHMTWLQEGLGVWLKSISRDDERHHWIDAYMNELAEHMHQLSLKLPMNGLAGNGHQLYLNLKKKAALEYFEKNCKPLISKCEKLLLELSSPSSHKHLSSQQMHTLKGAQCAACLTLLLSGSDKCPECNHFHR
jgi:hypothetical protein